ncbi:MAG: hypothetical protein EZS28_044917, partial [Streblomastix strix]
MVFCYPGQIHTCHEWRHFLLSRPEEKRRAELLALAIKLIDQYNGTKSEDYDPTSERATQPVREALLERVDMTLSLEFNKKILITEVTEVEKGKIEKGNDGQQPGQQ